MPCCKVEPKWSASSSNDTANGCFYCACFMQQRDTHALSRRVASGGKVYHLTLLFPPPPPFLPCCLPAPSPSKSSSAPCPLALQNSPLQRATVLGTVA